MKREEQKLSGEFLKDQWFEKVLVSMNEALFKEQGALLEDHGHIYPTLHILGAPRSGTTLASQLISSFLPVGYINNFIATYWKAPVYGIELSKKLLGLEYVSNFKSSFGRTDAIREPHEFGYFWNYHLKYPGLQQQEKEHEKEIDWEDLSIILNNICYRFDRPAVFKSFLLGFHAAKVCQVMPKTCFIYIKRNFLDNALSILKLRKKLNGDVNTWGSIKPLQYERLKELDVYAQISGQILALEYEYFNQLDKVPQKNKLFFRHEDICEDPASFLGEIGELLNTHDTSFNPEILNVQPFQKRIAEVSEGEKTKFLKAKDRVLQLFPEFENL
ncbi:sulfotransferase [Sinomicrobium weinanense]|uniref:Sulfotransferase n=1 Tax=Sinomicrobium weinanense TaxID=2842200 RepID=A0A926JVV0_9FLAO|nr:sulfotransferase [Sinomicrobium weinanense]MBC9798132.1 sulfotransferase [Sinomicrobium weinanense]MBU3123707.1 sulfotransferase [Sinomicrobium weinanense]